MASNDKLQHLPWLFLSRNPSFRRAASPRLLISSPRVNPSVKGTDHRDRALARTRRRRNSRLARITGGPLYTRVSVCRDKLPPFGSRPENCPARGGHSCVRVQLQGPGSIVNPARIDVINVHRLIERPRRAQQQHVPRSAGFFRVRARQWLRVRFFFSEVSR